VHAQCDLARELRGAVDFFYHRVFIGKALNPNNPEDFLRILATLGKAVKGITGPAEAAAMREAIGMLHVDWASMRPSQREKVVDAARAVLVRPGPLLIPKVEDVLVRSGLGIGAAARKRTKEAYKLSIEAELSKVDMSTIESIAKDQNNFIRDEFGRRSEKFGKKARGIVAEGLAAGKDTAAIAADLSAGLAGAGRSEAYWDLIASTFANRSRVYSNLSSYHDGGIDWFIVEAVLDERTSDICRFMHGKRFKVERALNDYAKADRKGVEAAQPWMSVGTNDEGDKEIYYEQASGNRRRVATIEESGVGRVNESGTYGNALSDAKLAASGLSAPPYHSLCRTTCLPDL
jgi:hypothetical protein